MSKGIAAYTAKHGRTLLLILAAVSIGLIGAYVAYPYSSAERAMMAKIGRSAGAAGLADFFGSSSWTQSDH
jgi:hypothetical protein